MPTDQLPANVQRTELRPGDIIDVYGATARVVAVRLSQWHPSELPVYINLCRILAIPADCSFTMLTKPGPTNRYLSGEELWNEQGNELASTWLIERSAA